MIYVKLNDESYSYDVHSLIKAFYPESDVRIVQADEDIHSGDDTPEFSVYAGEEKIEISELSSGQVLCAIGADHGLPADRAEYKSELKRQLYRALSGYTGKELPWGTLTGIRPTKLAMGYIDDNRVTAEENGQDITDGIVRMYMENYLACEEKSRLALDIALREKRVLDDIALNAAGRKNSIQTDTSVIKSSGCRRILSEGYSLYIGIPFCPSRCLYCSFMSYPIAANKGSVPLYLEAVKKEIDYVAEGFAGRRLDSIYIGGGTPTTLTSEELRSLIEYVKDKIDTSKIREFTVEAGRADSIDEDKLKTLKALGVDRISVNPQTLNEDTLRLIGRKATASETVAAYRLAREVGFDNINMDIILGLPGETIDDIKNTLEGIAELKPDDLTVHALSVKRGSKLAELLLSTDRMNGKGAAAGDTGVRTGSDGDPDIMLRNNTIDYDEAMRLTNKTAASIGLHPYYLYRQKNISGNLENTGFAGKGKEGIYNILMMEEVQDIVAVGAGTVSKRVKLQPDGNVRIDRCDTHKDLKLYIENIDEMIIRKRRLFGS